MTASLWRAALCSMLCLAGACSTIVEGNDQTVTVSTDPAGASCELRRGGQLIGVVNPTPGSVSVEKSSDDISVVCEMEGYDNAAGTFDSEFENMTLGNILFGGIIGVGVDAASGALNEYPSSVTIRMSESEPVEPASTEADVPTVRPAGVPTS